jgi:transposase
MARFIEGAERSQSVLFPERLEDWIGEDNPVRVIDVFVDEMDLGVLGFERSLPADTGRPGYDPATLLKIYIYGYLNRVQSSRRLEREAQRNVELMWLTRRLAPDFKTIADFRRDNGPAIRKVCSRFVTLCRNLKLFSEAIVAIDGSKFKAVNNRDRNFTEHKIKMRLAHLEASVQEYLEQLDRADRQPAEVPEERVKHLKDKMATVKKEIRRLEGIEKDLAKSPDQQVSLTDPDSRSMNSAGKGTGIVGYNVQAVVDAKNHMIVAHEVTNEGSERSQLTNMAKMGREATWQTKLTVLADRGYFNGKEILDCDRAGFIPLVPKPLTSNSKADGRFDKRDFVYNARRDEYRCPAGKKAIWRMTTVERGMTLHRYWSSDCPKCPMKAQCTPSPYRRITRWEHEEVLDKMQRRLDKTPEASKWRRQTVEHVFGTLKMWMGSTHFLTKTLPKVRTEMSLHVLAYNMKRAISILGMQTLMQAMRA